LPFSWLQPVCAVAVGSLGQYCAYICQLLQVRPRSASANANGIRHIARRAGLMIRQKSNDGLLASFAFLPLRFIARFYSSFFIDCFRFIARFLSLVFSLSLGFIARFYRSFSRYRSFLSLVFALSLGFIARFRAIACFTQNKR
jgi:hypothetical protein